MPQRRILILSAKFGEGHYQVGEALANALSSQSSAKSTISHLDFGSFFFKRTDYLIRSAYLKMVQKTPEIWRLIYEKTLDLTIDHWRMLGYGLGSKNLLNYIREFDPDVIINTHFIPAGILADFKRKGQLKPTLITAVTDYYVHGVWINPGVNLYLVSCRDAYDRLREAQIGADRIVLTGIPLRKAFDNKLDKAEARETLGLIQGMKTVLIMGGSSGLAGKENEVLESIQTISQSIPLQILVVCGSDSESYYKFSAKLKDFHLARVMGYVENIQELMAASDLLITKGGALTISEALTMGLPVLMYKPIPGHEDGNASFVENGGAGRKVQTPQELSKQAVELLSDPKSLKKMGLAAQEMLIPNAADKAAKAILDTITQKEPLHLPSRAII